MSARRAALTDTLRTAPVSDGFLPSLSGLSLGGRSRGGSGGASLRSAPTGPYADRSETKDKEDDDDDPMMPNQERANKRKKRPSTAEEEQKEEELLRKAMEIVQNRYEELIKDTSRTKLANGKLRASLVFQEQKVLKKLRGGSADKQTIEAAEKAASDRLYEVDRKQKELLEKAEKERKDKEVLALATAEMADKKRKQAEQSAQQRALEGEARSAQKEKKRAEAQQKLADLEDKAAALAKSERCSKALRALHRIREKLKHMRDRFSAATVILQNDCELNDDKLELIKQRGRKPELSDYVEPWVFEMWDKLVDITKWIEDRERLAAEAWDVDEHEDLLNKGHLISSDDESEGESQDDDGDVAKKVDWYRDGASEGNGHILDNIDEDGMPGDDDSGDYQIDFLLKLDMPEQTPEFVKKVCDDIARNFLKFVLDFHVTTVGGEAGVLPQSEGPQYGPFDARNIAVYQTMVPGEFIVSLILMEYLIDMGEETPEGQSRPKDIIAAALGHVPPSMWQHWAGDVPVKSIHETGIPEIHPEESEWLDNHYPGWAELQDRALLFNLAELARAGVMKITAENDLTLFNASNQEKRAVYDRYHKSKPGFPEDWYTNTDFQKREDMNAELMLFMLQGARDRLMEKQDEEDKKNNVPKKADEDIDTEEKHRDSDEDEDWDALENEDEGST